MYSLKQADRGPVRRRGAVRAMAGLALVVGMLTLGVAPAVAATGTAVSPQHAAVVKPVPKPPAGIPVGRTNVAKPHNNGSPIRPLIPWSVTLSASPNNTWPTEYSTLTAVASQDVGPTPYYIYIHDLNAGTTVAVCGTGTTCAVSITFPTPTDECYYAYIAAAGGYPPVNEQAQSSVTCVDWQGLVLNLTASQYTLPVGNISTLTWTTTADIGPTPFWVEIWDTTTTPYIEVGGSWGSGTTGSVNVSQNVAGTHSYLATFANSSSTYPPPNLQTTSPTDYVTWSNSGWTITLSAPAITVNGPETVTATANADVGPTQYFIEIFNENGTLLWDCGSGSVCSFSYTPASYPGSNLVAFVSNSATTLPPPNIQASSNTVNSIYEFIQ